MGSLAAGGAAAMGSGAFTAMSAERDAQINVVADDDGLIALDPGLDSDTVKLSDNPGELVIDTSLGGETGINNNSIYEFGQFEGMSLTEFDDELPNGLTFVLWAATHWSDGAPQQTKNEIVALTSPDDNGIGPAPQGMNESETGPEIAVSDDEYAFRVTNNDTTDHDIQLTVPTEGPVLTENGGTQAGELPFEGVGAGEYLTVLFVVIAGENTAGTELSGKLGISAE